MKVYIFLRMFITAICFIFLLCCVYCCWVFVLLFRCFVVVFFAFFAFSESRAQNLDFLCWIDDSVKRGGLSVP